MSPINYFLNALENRLTPHRGIFVPKLKIEAGAFKAYKNYTQEVWLVDGSNKQLIASYSISDRAVTDTEKEHILQAVYTHTIEKVLEHYGI